MRSLLAASWLLLTTATVRADVEQLEIHPNTLNPAAAEIHGPHLALHDSKAPSRHRLVVFFIGTNGVAASKLPVLSPLARDGYHVIALDYPNTVVAAKFRTSKDAHAFDEYRRALVHGGRVDETLTVAAGSSIETRLIDALRYLAAERGNEGWSEYSNKSGVQWEKLILVGHSQGAGHAAYLAHEHKVAKVLAVAGPQDYLTVLAQPAAWLSAASATPRDRYRALLHRADEFDANLQIATNRALAGPRAKEQVFTTHPPAQNPAPSILISERPVDPTQESPPTAHGALATPPYANTWLYLLAH